MKGMGPQQQVGVITLATAGLQQQLGQGLGAALDALMRHLSREACQRCQAALDSCHSLTKYLCKLSHISPRPTSKDSMSHCLQRHCYQEHKPDTSACLHHACNACLLATQSLSFFLLAFFPFCFRPFYFPSFPSFLPSSMCTIKIPPVLILTSLGGSATPNNRCSKIWPPRC